MPDRDLPGIDFATFVLSVSHSALLHLGDVADEDGHVETNLPLAKQNIDLLAMLEDKTKGNLTGDEERLLVQVMEDVRHRYDEHRATKAPSTR